MVAQQLYSSRGPLINASNLLFGAMHYPWKVILWAVGALQARRSMTWRIEHVHGKLEAERLEDMVECCRECSSWFRNL